MFTLRFRPLTSLVALAAALQVCSSARAADKISFSEHSIKDTRLALPLYSWQRASSNQTTDKTEPKSVMLCLHGFPMHGRTYDVFARAMVEQGFIVYAPDMRGLGNSYFCGTAPKMEYMTHTDDDLAEVAKWVRSQHPGKKLFVTGESMGGSFALRLGALHPKLVDGGLIVSGTGLELSRHYLRLIPAGILSAATQLTQVDFSGEVRGFFTSDPNVKAELMSDPYVRHKFKVLELLQPKQVARSTERMLKQIPSDIPILVLQALDDEMCLPSGACVLKRELQTSDLSISYFDDRGHVLLETRYLRKDTLKSVTDWLQVHNK